MNAAGHYENVDNWIMIFAHFDVFLLCPVADTVRLLINDATTKGLRKCRNVFRIYYPAASVEVVFGPVFSERLSAQVASLLAARAPFHMCVRRPECQ